MESFVELFKKVKPFLAVIFIQSCYALMSIIAKFALNKGMSPNVLVTYRMACATVLVAPFAVVLERHSRPRMTFKTFWKIVLLSLLGPVLDQNLFYTGMKHTTASFTSAMCNILPAITFLMACIFRLEKVEIRRRHSQAKVIGTLVAVGGAMLMTLVKGRALQLPRTISRIDHLESYRNNATNQDLVKGAIMITMGCFSWSCFIILQAVILKSYPAELSLTALICMMGTVETAMLTCIIERKNIKTVWSIPFKIEFLASIYGGLVSGLAYYIIGWVMKDRGPVFVSAFNPLNMVIIAIITPFVFKEDVYLGRIIGAIVIVIGIYMVLWGKSKDQNPCSSNEEGNEKITKKEGEIQMKNGDDAIDNGESAVIDAARVNPCEDSV